MPARAEVRHSVSSPVADQPEPVGERNEPTVLAKWSTGGPGQPQRIHDAQVGNPQRIFFGRRARGPAREKLVSEFERSIEIAQSSQRQHAGDGPSGTRTFRAQCAKMRQRAYRDRARDGGKRFVVRRRRLHPEALFKGGYCCPISSGNHSRILTFEQAPIMWPKE